MNLKKDVFLLLGLILISCDQKSQQIAGVWYHLGLNQTENTYYNETEWDTKKSEFLKKGIPHYEKLNLKTDFSFTSQLFDLETGKEFGALLNGTWKIENQNLILNVKLNEKNKNAELSRAYLIKSNSSKQLDLKIIKEIVSENGKEIKNYDLAVKEKQFNDLINKIGIDKTEFLSKPEEYSDDFWDIQNFGKYQILSRQIKLDEDISMYPESIQDIITGDCGDYVPCYDPIFESERQQLIFDKNNVLIIRYQDLATRSEDCGTLSNTDYIAMWNWDKSENLITVNFNNSNKVPFQVLNLFRSKELKTEKFKILAKNEKVMIWESVQ